jgi:tetratricopeptide (TPR) repeat protein
VAEQAEPALQGGDQGTWYQQLETEQGNMRAALTWLLQSGEPALALRLAGAVWRFWQRHGDFKEGRGWLEAGLARGPDVPANVRAKALWGASWLAYHQGDYMRAEALSAACLALARAHGDMLGFRNALTGVGMAAMAQGRYAEAVPPLQESLDLCRPLGKTWHLATSHLNLGVATMHMGDHARAVALLADALNVYRELGDEVFTARTLGYLAYAALLQGDHRRAELLFVQCLRAFYTLHEQMGIAEGLNGLTAVWAATEREEPAARIAAVAAGLRERLAAQAHPFDRDTCRRYLRTAQQHLGEVSWTAAWEAGRAMPLEQAIAYALQTAS